MARRRLHLGLLWVGPALLAGWALDRAPRTPQPPEQVPTAQPAFRAAAPAVAALPAPPSVRRYELLALRLGRSGRPVAVIRTDGAAARAFGLGDSLGTGVRLALIEAAGVEIERGRVRERLPLPASAAPLSVPVVAEPLRLDDPVGVIARPPDVPLPSSTPLERAIARARRGL